MVTLNGAIYASNYNNDKTRSFYDLAKTALASGKNVAIYADAERTISVTSCRDYDATGCIDKNSTTPYPIIQELAIVP